MYSRVLEGNPSALPLTAAGAIYVLMGLVVGIDSLIGGALAVLGIANIMISGYIYYDE